MNKEEFAAMLDGREYRSEMTKDQVTLAEVHSLVVVYGASDDLCEFRGAIREEHGAGDETDILFSKDGTFLPDDLGEHEDWLKEHNIYALFMEKFKNKVTARWCAGIEEGDPSWSYTTDIPHAKFRVMDEGDLYCIGIVFHLSDLK